MKEGWEYKKFGEVCWYNKNNGLHKSTRYVGMEHIEQGTGRLLCTISSDDVLSNTFAFNKGDVLYGRLRPYLKKVIVADFDGCCSTELFPIQSKDIIAPFLKYWFLTDEITNKINATCAGCRMPRGNMNDVLKFDISYPSISEQQSIVDYLDSAFVKIDAMKANAEKALNEAKALFQASLKEMLEPKEGWEEKTLKEVAKYRRGSFPQPYGNKEWYDGAGAMPFVQVAELQEDSFDMIPVTKRRISKIAQPLSVFVPAGTVLVSLQGSIGKVAITNYDSYVDRTIAIFQDYKINIDKTFFAYQLKIRFEIERIKARGTTIKTITKEEFANFIINCPPLSEQQSIVATLDSFKSKVDLLKANYEKISLECDALKQAILRQVFE